MISRRDLLTQVGMAGVFARVASPGALMAQAGVTCGDWFESRAAGGDKRWRLNWVTPIRGTCVLKHYESHAIETIGLDELRQRIDRGEMIRVAGLGLLNDVLSEAMAIVGRQLRRPPVVPLVALGKTNRNQTALRAAHIGH